MSYQLALRAAGANVLDFQRFGDWQGTWLALVEYDNQRGVVLGYFGSCSGCDAWQATFGDITPWCDEHWGDEDPLCPDCAKAQAKHLVAVAEFGTRYLDDCWLDRHDVEAELANTSRDRDWDHGADDICKWFEHALKQLETH